MKGKELLQNHLYHFFCVVLLYCIMGFYIRDYYGLSIPRLIIVLLGIIWVLLLRMFDQYKKTLIPYLIVGIILIIAIFLSIKYYHSLKVSLRAYYDWLLDILYYDKPTIGEGLNLAYTLLTFCLINLLCFPFYLITKTRIGRFILAIVGLGIAVVMIVTEYYIDQSVSAFFFAYFFTCLIEYSFTRQTHASAKESQAITTFLTPFAALLLIMCCVLPTRNAPMQYKFIKNVWNQIVKYSDSISSDFNNWLNPPVDHELNLAVSGFGEDGKLGDDVSDSKKVALSIKDNKPKSTNLYLIGNVKNEFTGDEWINTLKKDDLLSKYKENELQILELTNALSKNYIPLANQNIVDSRQLSITYHKQSTKTVFSQANTGGYKEGKKVPKIIEEEGHLKFKKLPKNDPRYQVESLQLRLGTDATNQFLIRQTRQPYNWNVLDDATLYNNSNILLKLYSIPEIHNVKEILQHRSEYIKDNYLKLPSDLSEQVIQLSNEVTKKGNSTYEKLKLLEEYLNTYTYSKHPTPLPKGKHVLDYFLFESKKGYCTYFATAMTIMGRCIGVPTRYVQGYCVPTKDSNYTYDVLGNNAHAWVEAYLEGVGWVAFEPTAGYGSYLYRARETYPSSSGYSYQTQPNQQIRQDTIKKVIPQVEEIHTKETLTKAKTYLYALAIVILVILLITLLSAGYFYIIIRYSKASYKRASMQKRLNILLRRIVFLCDKYRFCTEDNPTLWKQFESMKKIEELGDSLTIEVANRYMLLCYGDVSLNEADEHKIVDFYQRLLQYGKTYYSPLKYYLLLLRLAKIKNN